MSISAEVDTQITHQSIPALRLIRNYAQTSTIEDLNKVISIMEHVIDMTPRGSIHSAGMLSNFGAMMGTRFEQTGSVDDLNRAVEYFYASGAIVLA